jgi:MT0933-like antitoxin protein
MGLLGDRFKELRDQAQHAVAENKEKIEGAVQQVGEVANIKTKGKYADKIAKVGDKVSSSVDKFGATGEDAGAPAGAPATDASTEPASAGSATPTESAPAAEAPAPAAPPATPPAVPPTSPPDFDE